jgi:hypothetical protein
MKQPVQPSPREHHFFVAISKFFFHHPDHGIVQVEDPIRVNNAELYGLSPFILYGVSVAGLPIRWMTFTAVSQPRAFRDVLQEAWRKAEGLRGLPDILRINRHLAVACPGLAWEMGKIGVQVEIADGKDKSFPASLRFAQDSSQSLLWGGEVNDRSLAGSVQSLCRYAQDDHDKSARLGRCIVRIPAIKAKFQEWLKLPVRKAVPTVTGGLDWEPGPWLLSWETSLPPNRLRYFKFNKANGSTWLITGEKPPDYFEEGDDDDFLDYEFDNVAEITKNLLACWPYPLAEIARCAGITLRELQWFISGKALLDQDVRVDLEALLGIDFDCNVGRYVGAGPYVLVANKPLALKEVYENISHGGDASPCEIIPSKGAADPSWRYVLINPYGDPPSIVMAPRGEKITDRLPELLLNYEGIRDVSPNLYRDVVSTCARACREPTANVREMKDFMKRYEENWKDGLWLPD